MQRQLNRSQWFKYEFEESIVKVKDYLGNKDVFDFRDFTDGELEVDELETDLFMNPILEAKKENGVLKVILWEFIGFNLADELNTSEWIDHTEYQPPEIEKEGEDVGEDEVEEPI